MSNENSAEDFKSSDKVTSLQKDSESTQVNDLASSAISTGKDDVEPSRVRRTTDVFSDWDAYRTSKIDISVDKPVLREELFSKYLVYKIYGSDLKGYYEARRRYSDFEKIRNLLVQRWPGCFIPSLPPKAFNNMDQSLIDDRYKHLESFCKKIAERPHLFYSDVFQLFLRNKMIDLDPILQAFTKVKYSDIINRYSRVFRHLEGKDLNTETVYKIIKFNAFLQRVQGQFEKYKSLAKKFAATRKDFSQQLVAMHDIMAMGYERQVFSEYHDGRRDHNVFYDEETNPKLNANIESVKQLQQIDTIEHIYEWIKSEHRDIEAFREAFNQREKFESLKAKAEVNKKSDEKTWENVNAGKQSLKNRFNNHSKEYIENKLTTAQKEAEELSIVQDMITLVLAYEEIDRFKALRVEKFYQIVGKAAEGEINCFNVLEDYWTNLTENIHVKNVET